MTKLPESHTLTTGMPLVFATPKKTGLDPGLYRVTHQQFPPKYLRILPTARNELTSTCLQTRWPTPPPTANIAVQPPPVVSRQNVAVLQPGPAKHSYQVRNKDRNQCESSELSQSCDSVTFLDLCIILNTCNNVMKSDSFFKTLQLNPNF